MKDKEKVIHNILSQINWEYVLYSVKELKVLTGKVTKLELVDELTGYLLNVIETNKKHLITDLWDISYEILNNEKYILEVVFTPVIAFSNTYNSSISIPTVDNRVEMLQQRLKLALEVEDYENATKINKSLKKLLKVKN
jgi:hypothetical protein